MAGHTPGPWAYEIVPSDEHERALAKAEWTGLFIGPEGDCEYAGTVDHTIFEGGFAHGLKDGDPEADARLMTAAPELYAALITAKQEMWLSARSQWNMSDFKNWAVIQQIDAALEKADGKTRTEATPA